MQQQPHAQQVHMLWATLLDSSHLEMPMSWSPAARNHVSIPWQLRALLEHEVSQLPGTMIQSTHRVHLTEIEVGL